MKTNNKIARFIATAAVMMLMLACGSSVPQGYAAKQDSVLVQRADGTAVRKDVPISQTPGAPNQATSTGSASQSGATTAPVKFDGYALYKATFEALRDNHIVLTDPAVRAKWVAEWENKHAKDGKLDTEDGADAACLEMMRSLNQRYDYYFLPAKTKAEESSEKPTFAGTGLVVTTLGEKTISKEHPFFIAMVIEGSPAARENLRKKDRITAIDGKSVDGKTLEEAVALLHGDNGVPVVLSIERGSEKFNVTIVRHDYIIPVVHFKDMGDSVSYVKLDNFMSEYSVKEMFNALRKAAKGKALILDLRGNHGGSLQYVEMMAQFFLEDGTVVEQHERDGDNLSTLRLVVQPNFALRTQTSSTEPDSTGMKPEERMVNLLPKDMPVVVLVDDDSYSASEILAGALQANHRAVVIGIPTGGKGVGQVVRKLPFGRSMHVTSFEFLPGGQAMDWVGVIPNIEVKQPANFDADDASTDAQLKAALTQVKSMLEAQTKLQKQRDELRKKNEDDFQKSRQGN